MTQLLQQYSLDGLFRRQIVSLPHVMLEIELRLNQDCLSQIRMVRMCGVCEEALHFAVTKMVLDRLLTVPARHSVCCL